MVKITISDYVKTLISLLEGVGAQEREKRFRGFLQLVDRNRQLDKLPQIIESYHDYLNDLAERVEVVIDYGGQEPSKNQLGLIRSFLEKRFVGKHINLRLCKRMHDMGLIVGAGEHRFNLTLKKQLKDFASQLATS
jgi:F0F1-type ATP synthase delta subunit